MRENIQLKLRTHEDNALIKLKKKLLEIQPDSEIILYGSKARGDDDKYSDIDILILVGSPICKNLKTKIREIVYNTELEYDVVFGTIIENRNFWQSPIANAMPIHWNIDKEGVVL
ncbi:MAG: nucleotidyltransferase domain-containing protein [bacterium]